MKALTFAPWFGSAVIAAAVIIVVLRVARALRANRELQARTRAREASRAHG